MSTGIGSALWQTIRDDAELITAISGKFYPVQLPPHATYPAVVWGQVNENQIITKDGPIPDGWRFQIDVYAPTYAAAQSVAQRLKVKLNWYTASFTGDLGNVRIVFEDQSDAMYQEDKELIKITQDYILRKN